MSRKPLDSWVFSLLHLCAPVLSKGIIFASGALFVGAGRGLRLSSGLVLWIDGLITWNGELILK